MASVTW